MHGLLAWCGARAATLAHVEDLPQFALMFAPETAVTSLTRHTTPLLQYHASAQTSTARVLHAQTRLPSRGASCARRAQLRCAAGEGEGDCQGEGERAQLGCVARAARRVCSLAKPRCADKSSLQAAVLGPPNPIGRAETGRRGGGGEGGVGAGGVMRHASRLVRVWAGVGGCGRAWRGRARGRWRTSCCTCAARSC